MNKSEEHALISGSGTTAFTLTAQTAPNEVDVSWASDDTDVATVDDGAVETLDDGVAVITASATGYEPANCAVYVHTLGYDTTDTCTAGETYEWKVSYTDENENKVPIAISDIEVTEGSTATAGDYDAETESITISVTVPAGAEASSEITVSATATVGASEEAISLTLTVAE